MNNIYYDHRCCRKLAAKVLVEAIAAAADGDDNAKSWLTGERAAIFLEEATGFHCSRLQTLLAAIDDLDLSSVKIIEPARSTRWRPHQPTTNQKRLAEKRARRILAAEPEITGAELGRRLGHSQSYALRLKSMILEEPV